jgi:hypothetical protein
MEAKEVTLFFIGSYILKVLAPKKKEGIVELIE